MFCKNCGKQIPDHSELCPLCGSAQSITELEYRTGARTPAGALLKSFRREPATRQAAIILEILGILWGVVWMVFAIIAGGEDFSFARALLLMGGGGLSLGFGLALTCSLAKCRKEEE